MILVVGASGFIGGRTLAALLRRGDEAIGTGRTRPMRCGDHAAPRLDATDYGAVCELFESNRPSDVIFAAGEPNVDKCEIAPDHSRRQNVDAVRNVARACEKIGAHLTLLSTNAVFGEGHHGESDTPSPINVYGHHKCEAEQVAWGETGKLAIVRTSNVYGWDVGVNSLMQVVRQVLKNEPFIAPDDQMVRPTLVDDVASALAEISAQRLIGIYHVVGPEVVDRFTFARRVAAMVAADVSLVRACRLDEQKRASPQAHRCILRCSQRFMERTPYMIGIVPRP